MMGMTRNMSDYFQRATGARSLRAMATATGVEQSTLNRQLTGKTGLTVEMVVAICRTYELDLADTFVDVGFITEAEAERLGARIGLSVYTDLELAREIVRRIEQGEAGEDLTGDLPMPSARVTSINVRGRVQDDLDAVASERTGDDESDEGYEG